MSFLVRAAKMVNAWMPFGWRLAHPEALPIESGYSLSQLHAAVHDLSLHLGTVETELVGAAKRHYASLGPDVGLTVLHDDADYRTVARHAPDLAEQNIHDLA